MFAKPSDLMETAVPVSADKLRLLLASIPTAMSERFVHLDKAKQDGSTAFSSEA